MPDTPRRRRLVACAVLVLLCLTGTAGGCGRSSGPRTLTVLAASSLTEVLGELVTAYTQTHRDVRLETVFGGSQEMAARLEDRDTGDVLITADETAMDQAAADLVGPRRVVAHNSMTIAVAPGNPRRIRGLSSLTRRGLRIAVAAESVPAGRYARQMLARANLTVRWSSEEINVRAVLDRVRTGEADAGLVYITDLRSAGIATSSVPIPAEQNVTAAYPASAVKDSAHPQDAADFVDWLTTPTARALFHKHGFVLPKTSQG
ncbi:molybdate ABC transporter substrate-binding protein [Actinomadura keratinilytica]|uniref:Molybdate ABC transporter substrate-binding protein n=1 Tax=Actinomadura keratinilytica TaxID=547461 RepID=A0ABP7YXC0_9ACTN